ncbi:MAG: hypothetical protein PHI50_00780 [Alphaproteobacteria bacterium]|nr:hypothetical protein [Alphaproteobacteria bacterium]
MKIPINEIRKNQTVLYFIKAHRYLVLTLFLFLFGTLVTGLLGLFLFGVPLVWAGYELALLYQKKTQKVEILHIPQMVFSLRFSVLGGFISFLWFLLFTPDWIKKLSLFLERNSFISLFEIGSYLYGLLFVALIIFILLFVGSYYLFRPKENI